jgi:3-oxoacyl-[acyl-carrier protein] reductase
MRKALVTGASGAIGAAVTRTLSENGYQVAAAYCHHEAAAKKLFEEKHAAAVLQADLRFPKEAARLASLAQHRLGGVDTLVYAAGTTQMMVMDDITDELAEEQMRLQVTSLFALCRALVPDMRQMRFGRIIVVSSMWGRCGAAMESIYSAAKAGQIGLVKALARELGPSGITANAICPGLIDTPMNDALPAEAVQDMLLRTPVPRLGTPKDVASAAGYLSSEAASFVTGQVLGVDGGYI